MSKQYVWESPKNRIQYKHNNEYSCKIDNDCRIIRKDGNGKLIYQFFLDNDMYNKIKNYFSAGSWTQYKHSVIHFYSSNYIYCEWSDGYEKICEILGIKIKWD